MIRIGAGVATILIMVGIAFMWSVYMGSKVIPIQPENHLRIDGEYLLKESETNSSINASCMIYLTNLWRESGDIKIVYYVMDSKGLAEFKGETEVGKIKKNATQEVKLPLVLKRNDSRIDILIFEDDLLTMKGHLYINVYYRFYDTSYKKGEWRITVESSDFQNMG